MTSAANGTHDQPPPRSAPVLAPDPDNHPLHPEPITSTPPDPQTTPPAQTIAPLNQQNEPCPPERSEGPAVDLARPADSHDWAAEPPTRKPRHSLINNESAAGILHALYKTTLSPLLHIIGIQTGGCRFQPTCSEYAALAFAQHGYIKGFRLTLKRLLRCQPFARGGWDPVPPLRSRPLENPPTGTIEMPHSTHDRV